MYYDWYKRELKERELLTRFFKQTGLTDYKLTAIRSYSPYDAVVYGRIPVECKVRDFNLAFLNGTYHSQLLIEWKKYNRLMEYGKALYINFLLDGVVFVHYLPQDIVWTGKNCPLSSTENRGIGRKIVGFLEATRYYKLQDWR